MPSSHLSLGIAQVVLYTPVVPLAIFQLRRNRGRKPLMAWFSLAPFSLMRLAGGIITILYRENSSTGLFIANLLLLNVGAIPLIVVDVGYTRLIFLENFSGARFADRIHKALRAALIVAASLLSAGAGVSGGTSASTPELTRDLTLAGYSVFAAILVSLIITQLFMLPMRAQIDCADRKILYAALAVSPFLIVRNVYGLLEVSFELDANSIWNPVTGSVARFAVMALLMEYIAVMIYFYAGFTTPNRVATKNTLGP